MPRFRREDRERLVGVVRECKLGNLSTTESLEYIQKRLQLKITDRTLRNIKAELKEEAKQEIEQILREDFMLEAYQRIQELRKNYASLMALKDEARKVEDAAKRVKMLHEIEVTLSDLTFKLASLYDAMPFVCAVQERITKERIKNSASSAA